MINRREVIKIVAGAAVVAPFAAYAQDYPSRTTTIVVPYAAGGGTDITARLLASKLSERLKQTFVVENRLGSGGIPAAAAVAKSTPDGYTLMFATSTQLAVQPTLHKKLPYDPTTDFIPLALIASAPFVLIVPSASPINSVQDLIKAAKERPGRVTFGSSGVGAGPHLFTEMLMGMTDTKMTHVPYQGTALAINDLLGGHIQLIFCDIGPALPLIKAGTVKALGISSTTRFVNLPDVAPIAELGVPGYEAVAWQMLIAPAGTPPAVVDKIHGEMKLILADPEFKQKIVATGVIPIDTPAPAELSKFVKSEVARWAKVVTQAGLAGSE